MATLDEIFQHEINLESGFQGILEHGTGVSVYHSRQVDTAISPRVETKIVVGKNLNHAHNFPNGQWVWDAWDGTLETEIITNRQSDSKHLEHRVLLGLVRQKLQLFNLVKFWKKHQEIVMIDDIREQGTVDSFQDTNDLDHSKITWSLIFNINPNAWPNTLNQ